MIDGSEGLTGQWISSFLSTVWPAMLSNGLSSTYLCCRYPCGNTMVVDWQCCIYMYGTYACMPETGQDLTGCRLSFLDWVG